MTSPRLLSQKHAHRLWSWTPYCHKEGISLLSKNSRHFIKLVCNSGWIPFLPSHNTYFHWKQLTCCIHYGEGRGGEKTLQCAYRSYFHQILVISLSKKTHLICPVSPCFPGMILSTTWWCSAFQTTETNQQISFHLTENGARNKFVFPLSEVIFNRWKLQAETSS